MKQIFRLNGSWIVTDLIKSPFHFHSVLGFGNMHAVTVWSNKCHGSGVFNDIFRQQRSMTQTKIISNSSNKTKDLSLLSTTS